MKIPYGFNEKNVNTLLSQRVFLLITKGVFIMAINETIVTGRKFRKLIDESTKLWQRISIWSKASDVEFDDGKNAETKIGAINGVTDSLTSTSSNIAASAKAVKELNDKVTQLSSNLTATKLWLGTIVTSSGSQNTYTDYSSPVPFFMPIYCDTTNRGTSSIAGSITINSSGVINYNLPFQHYIRSGSTGSLNVWGKIGVIDASRYSVVATGDTRSDKTVSESLDNVVVAYTSASFASGSINDYSAWGLIPQPYPTAKKSFIVPKHKVASSNYDTDFMYFNYTIYKQRT